ncbi:MAG TPA: hypothetical protein VEP91_02230 [Solirubrobacterales bacterium]|nr:hypothetical protein [Solirubrobacterales bacterium]
MSQKIEELRLLLGIAVVALAFLSFGAAGAAAATVVNGDFETGSLTGWSTEEQGSGEWIAYSGTANPFASEGAPALTAPPQGNFAAITVQDGQGAHILYQDVTVGSAPGEVLNLDAYYVSDAPMLTPSPDSLAESPSQQYRIDVMDPTASIVSVDPEDILAPVFATKTGDPQTMAPRKLSVDLTNLAGRTVRLRIAEADTFDYLNAGVDAVSIGTPPPPPPSPPANTFTFGKLKLNKKRGTATLKVTVPGGGTLTAVDAKKKPPKRIKKATATVSIAGTVTLKLKPTAAGKKTLKSKGKLKFKALVSFTPTGGTAGSQTFAGKLKLTLPK